MKGQAMLDGMAQATMRRSPTTANSWLHTFLLLKGEMEYDDLCEMFQTQITTMCLDCALAALEHKGLKRGDPDVSATIHQAFVGVYEKLRRTDAMAKAVD